MQSQPGEKKRNQRKSPLTPKKSFRKEDSPPAIAMRVGGRVKKAKIPFDPSDAVTKRRQTDSALSSKRFAGKDGASAVVQYTCCYCKKLDKNIFINCNGDCEARIHLNCLQSICENFGKHEEQSWECNLCQQCQTCNKGIANGKPLLKCYICYSYYHSKCHGAEDQINQSIVKENRFCCKVCEQSRKLTNTPNAAAKGSVPKKIQAFSQSRAKPASSSDNSKFVGDGKIGGFLGFNANDVIESSSTEDESNEWERSRPRLVHPSSSSSSAAQNQMQHHKQKQQQHSSADNNNRSSIEDDVCAMDASSWSTDQVFKYFKNIFPRHAHVFRDHEIDGPSLYLLKRGDIIRGFDIKIGPALKLYEHVLKLQTKKDDPMLAWH